MAKRSINSWSSSRLTEDEDTIFKPLDAPTTTKLALRKNLKLKIIGSVTANEYLFSGAGAMVDVDNRDVPKMMEKGLGGRSCCDSFSTPYFEIVR